MGIRTLTAGALLAASFALPAMAADLGGNCCADLEERVAELEATTARKGNRKMSLEVSGHVNQAILFFDGFGVGNERAIINNTNSESRFRFRGSAKIDGEWEAGFLMEFGAGDLNNSGGPSIRHEALYLKSKTFGTVWLGKTSEATDGIMEISLASQEAGILGALEPFNTFVADQSGLIVGLPFDGKRRNLVRWISPEVGGFVLSASWSDDEAWDASVRFAKEFGQFRIAAGAGYRHEDVSADIVFGPTNGEREFWGGSASVMHTPSGLFLDGQFGRSNGLQTVSFDLNAIAPPGLVLAPISLGTEAELDIWGIRGGFSKKLIAAGATTAYLEYNELKIDSTGISPTMFGAGVVQDIDAAAMSLYVSYRHYDLDLGGSDTADVVIAGAKVRF